LMILLARITAMLLVLLSREIGASMRMAGG